MAPQSNPISCNVVLGCLTFILLSFCFFSFFTLYRGKHFSGLFADINLKTCVKEKEKLVGVLTVDLLLVLHTVTALSRGDLSAGGAGCREDCTW